MQELYGMQIESDDMHGAKDGPTAKLPGGPVPSLSIRRSGPLWTKRKLGYHKQETNRKGVGGHVYVHCHFCHPHGVRRIVLHREMTFRRFMCLRETPPTPSAVGQRGVAGGRLGADGNVGLRQSPPMGRKEREYTRVQTEGSVWQTRSTS